MRVVFIIINLRCFKTNLVYANFFSQLFDFFNLVFIGLYHQELDLLSYPPDGESAPAPAPGQPAVGPYPFYDRWGDGWNLSQEFVILNQARSLGYLAWLMAQTPLKTQPWKPAPAEIVPASAPQPQPEIRP